MVGREVDVAEAAAPGGDLGGDGLRLAGATGGPWFAEAADSFVVAFASVGAVSAVLAALSAYAVWRLVPADLSLGDSQH